MSALLPTSVHQPTAEFLAQELVEVERIFEAQLASDLPAVNALCRHVERYRGKMLRPTLVLLTGLAVRTRDKNDVPAVSREHRVVAAVVEMIHMATLVHDDVLDEADVRRQGATVNRLRGNEMAVMLGDYLISNSFHLCSTLGDPAINLRLGQTTNTLCEGELIQLHHRENASLDEETYFEIVRRKTAVLVGACCRLGATLAGGSPAVIAALDGFGTALGIAFQIQDDLLDLAGRADIVGKSLGRDLEKGKVTLPIIIHLATADLEGRLAALDSIERRDAPRLLAQMRESGAIDAAHQRARSLVVDAKRELECLVPSPARDLLEAMAEAVVERER